MKKNNRGDNSHSSLVVLDEEVFIKLCLPKTYVVATVAGGSRRVIGGGGKGGSGLNSSVKSCSAKGGVGCI